jgi:hypothetical protein
VTDVRAAFLKAAITTVCTTLAFILVGWIQESQWGQLKDTLIFSTVFFAFSIAFSCVVEMRRRQLPGPR